MFDEQYQERTDEIFALLDQGHAVWAFTEHHFRIDGFIDVYPVNQRWHNIETDRRGGYKNLNWIINTFLR